MKKIKTSLNDKTIKMTKTDYIIASILTVVYAIISFINLGSMTNPQTFHYMQKDETITIEFNK